MAQVRYTKKLILYLIQFCSHLWLIPTGQVSAQTPPLLTWPSIQQRFPYITISNAHWQIPGLSAVRTGRAGLHVSAQAPPSLTWPSSQHSPFNGTLFKGQAKKWKQWKIHKSKINIPANWVLFIQQTEKNPKLIWLISF